MPVQALFDCQRTQSTEGAGFSVPAPSVDFRILATETGFLFPFGWGIKFRES